MSKLMAVFLLICAVVPSFASDTAPIKKAETSNLRWVIKSTGKVLWTVEDIVRFDWDQQIFELKRDKAMDLMSVLIGQIMNYRVEDADGEIYSGYFYNPISSMSSSGPMIYMFAMNGPKPPLYQIHYGPTDTAKKNMRFDPRLRIDLEKAGVLAKIDPSGVKLIEVKSLGWTNIGSDLKIWASLFPETLCVGGKARIHLTINADEKWAHDIDTIRVEMILLADKDNNVIAQELLRISTNDLKDWRNTFVCKFSQWSDDSNPAQKLSPGNARLVLKIFTEKQVAEQRIVCGTYHIEGGDVTILPAESSP